MSMLKEIMENGNEENGVVMIEAVYVVVIAVLIIFFTINVGVVYYNRLSGKRSGRGLWKYK